MELTAKLIKKENPIRGTGKNGEWVKQNIILETEGMYPKKVCVSVWGDKINVNDLREESLITVFFDIESREFNNNWYTDLRAWKIENASENHENLASKSTNSKSPDFKQGEEGEDLPF